MNKDTEYKLKTKQGWLTAYALACGYVEKSVSMDGDECITLDCRHGIYNVLGFELWESFYSITEARKFFKKELKKNNMKRVKL